MATHTPSSLPSSVGSHFDCHITDLLKLTRPFIISGRGTVSYFRIRLVVCVFFPLLLPFDSACELVTSAIIAIVAMSGFTDRAARDPSTCGWARVLDESWAVEQWS